MVSNRDRPRDLTQSRGQLLVLPDPPDAVDLPVVEEKGWIAGRSEEILCVKRSGSLFFVLLIGAWKRGRDMDRTGLGQGRERTYASGITADGEMPRGVHAPVVVADEALHRILECGHVGTAHDQGLCVVGGALCGAEAVYVAAEAALGAKC